MKQTSTKQQQRNREVDRIKRSKPQTCIFCGRYCEVGDGVHLLNKNIYSHYYTEPLNIWRGHRACHTAFDDGAKAYRASFTHIVEIVRTFATKLEVYQAFGID